MNVPSRLTLGGSAHAARPFSSADSDDSADASADDFRPVTSPGFTRRAATPGSDAGSGGASDAAPASQYEVMDALYGDQPKATNLRRGSVIAAATGGSKPSPSGSFVKGSPGGNFVTLSKDALESRDRGGQGGALRNSGEAKGATRNKAVMFGSAPGGGGGGDGPVDWAEFNDDPVQGLNWLSARRLHRMLGAPKQRAYNEREAAMIAMRERKKLELAHHHINYLYLKLDKEMHTPHTMRTVDWTRRDGAHAAPLPPTPRGQYDASPNGSPRGSHVQLRPIKHTGYSGASTFSSKRPSRRGSARAAQEGRRDAPQPGPGSPARPASPLPSEDHARQVQLAAGCAVAGHAGLQQLERHVEGLAQLDRLQMDRLPLERHAARVGSAGVGVGVGAPGGSPYGSRPGTSQGGGGGGGGAAAAIGSRPGTGQEQRGLDAPRGRPRNVETRREELVSREGGSRASTPRLAVELPSPGQPAASAGPSPRVPPPSPYWSSSRRISLPPRGGAEAAAAAAAAATAAAATAAVPANFVPAAPAAAAPAASFTPAPPSLHPPSALLLNPSARPTTPQAGFGAPAAAPPPPSLLPAAPRPAVSMAEAAALGSLRDGLASRAGERPEAAREVVSRQGERRPPPSADAQPPQARSGPSTARGRKRGQGGGGRDEPQATPPPSPRAWPMPPPPRHRPWHWEHAGSLRVAGVIATGAPGVVSVW